MVNEKIKFWSQPDVDVMQQIEQNNYKTQTITISVETKTCLFIV